MMKGLDKYIEYVIAQVGEGGHTRSELAEDLKERGLNNNEIEQVLDIAWSEGRRREDFSQNAIIEKIIKRMLLPVVIFVCILLAGGFGRHTLVWIIGGIFAIISVLLSRKRFK